MGSLQRFPTADPRFAALLVPGTPLLLVGIEARETGIGMLLETRRGGLTTWRAEDGVTFTLDRGMLVGTRGFTVTPRALVGDLMSVDASQTQTLLRQRRAGQTRRFHSYLNGEGQTQFHSFVCDVSSGGAGEATVNEVTYPAWIMTESCSGPDVTFENTYWMGSANQILQSRQWVGPFAGALQLQEVF